MLLACALEKRNGSWTEQKRTAGYKREMNNIRWREVRGQVLGKKVTFFSIKVHTEIWAQIVDRNFVNV